LFYLMEICSFLWKCTCFFISCVCHVSQLYRQVSTWGRITGWPTTRCTKRNTMHSYATFFVFPIYATIQQPVWKLQIRFPVLVYTGTTGVCVCVCVCIAMCCTPGKFYGRLLTAEIYTTLYAQK